MSSAALLLTACNNNQDNSEATTQTAKTAAESSSSTVDIGQYAKQFSGCYTVSHDEPAQIKVSQQNDRLVMQMKEPKSAGRVWDDPEPLEPIDLSQTKNYFSINKNNLTAIIGRPDRVFVLANIKPAYANINPMLDSEYLGFILQGANTIYKVSCDDAVNMDLIDSEDMSNITVKPIGKVEVQ